MVEASALALAAESYAWLTTMLGRPPQVAVWAETETIIRYGYNHETKCRWALLERYRAFA